MKLIHDPIARTGLLLVGFGAVVAAVIFVLGKDITISEFAQLVADVVGYRGRFMFDTSRPDGAPQKLLDVLRTHSSGLERQDKIAGWNYGSLFRFPR